jgi:hypothetical protein
MTEVNHSKPALQPWKLQGIPYRKLQALVGSEGAPLGVNGSCRKVQSFPCSIA